MKIRLGRRYSFFSSHCLRSPFLTPEENALIYGKCNHPHGHGHTYILKVLVEGNPHPRTGMICDLRELDSLVRDVLLRYHYATLENLPEYQELPSTGERVIRNLYLELKRALEGKPFHLYSLELEETRNNRFHALCVSSS